MTLLVVVTELLGMFFVVLFFPVYVLPYMEERFEARLKLAKLPRNSAPCRIRNRCEVTGRPRAFHRKMKMSRVALRELGSKGLIPGLVKSSW